MKAESNLKPAGDFKIEKHGRSAEIIFYCNVTEKEKGFCYEEYRLTVPCRDNLSANVEKNYDSWLKLAMAEESKEKPLTQGQEIEKIKEENELISAAITELIITVMGGE